MGVPDLQYDEIRRITTEATVKVVITKNESRLRSVNIGYASLPNSGSLDND